LCHNSEAPQRELAPAGHWLGPAQAAPRWAEQTDVATLRMVISRNNLLMRHLAHKAGARLDLDEIFADIALATEASPDIAACSRCSMQT